MTHCRPLGEVRANLIAACVLGPGVIGKTQSLSPSLTPSPILSSSQYPLVPLNPPQSVPLMKAAMLKMHLLLIIKKHFQARSYCPPGLSAHLSHYMFCFLFLPSTTTDKMNVTSCFTNMLRYTHPAFDSAKT